MKPAIRFKSLAIKNGRTFKDIELPLENQGIVAIQGPNGVGKSTIWSLLQVPFYSATPTGHKRDELTKNKRDSSIEVNYERNNKLCSVAYNRVKKKWKHSITIDGKDETPHDHNDRTKAAKDLLGLTKEEFEGSIHLTQNASHLLLNGKPSQRKQYISDFFNLDSRFDQVLTEAKNEFAKVSGEIEKVSALSQSKQVLEEEIKNYEQKDTSEIENRLKAINENITKQRAILDLLSKERDTISLYNSLITNASLFDNPEEIISKTESKIIELKSSINSAEVVKQHNQKARTTNQEIETLNSRISTLLDTYPNINDPSLSQERLNQLSVLKESYQKTSSLLEELKSLPIVEDVDLDFLQSELNKVRLEKSVWDRKVSAIEKGTCPECGSTFDSNSIEDTKQRVEQWAKVASTMETEVEQAKKTKQVFERRKSLENLTQGVTTFTQEMETELSNLRILLPKKDELKRLKIQLGSLDPMELLEEADTKQSEEEILSLERTLGEAKLCLQAKTQLPEAPKRGLEDIQKDEELLDKDIQNLQSIRDSLNSELGQIKFSNERYQNISSQIADIEKKLDNLDSLKKEEYYWKSLVDAYGPKGLRVKQLEKIMDLVLKTLPYYTNILFQEKGLEFRHKCDAGNIEVLAKRVEINGGKTETFEHDISSFSGGEQKRMSIAFVLTLAECVPLTKRANLLVLDEIDANLDADGQYRFINELLPSLKGKYESIFVISHAEEIQASAVYDKVWKISKKNHWSQVEMLDAS